MATDECSNPPAARQRAANPKVRTGCITCKARRIKCDEGKPACTRCSRTGRTCEGYRNVTPKTQMPRSLAVMPEMNSTTEHALEVFFLCTAPALAGLFEQAFFQGSVLQRSLREPTVRQAIAALGMLHDQATIKNIQCVRRQSMQPELPVKLYNRAITTMIQKVAADPNDLPLLAMVNVLFICFEYCQGNLEAAASHIKGGIDILNNWRSKNRKKPGQPYEQQYASLEVDFMETEIAPLLCTFNINAVHWGVEMRAGTLLNPATGTSGIVIPSRFESLKAARAILLNLTIFATCEFEPAGREMSNVDFPVICERVIASLAQWKVSFDDLVNRRRHVWNNTEKRMADAISVMHRNAELGVCSYQAQTNCDWEKYCSQYEETAALVNKITADINCSPNSVSSAFSLDDRMVFPLQPMAWRCRWPHLHRAGFDLRARLPALNMLPRSNHYDSVLSRVAEIEENYIKFAASDWQTEDQKDLETVKIRDHSVVLVQGEEGGPPSFAVTFWAKPDGLDGPWYSFTENMHLGRGKPDNVPCTGSQDYAKVWSMSRLSRKVSQEDMKIMKPPSQTE